MGISTALEAPAAAQPREAAAAGSSPGGLAARPCADRQSTACRALSRSPVFLATLVLVTSLGPLAMSAFVPAIPMIQAEFAVDGAVAQLTLSVSLIAMAFASLVYGSLADRYGRRPVLLFGIAVGVLGSVLCAVGPTIGSVIAGRALQATGASTGFVLARVIVQDVYGSARSARVLAYVTAAMTLAPLIGPLAGGYLIDGVGWRAVLVATALAAAALLVLVALRLPETAPRLGVSRRATPARDIAELLRNASYLKFMAFGTMSMAAFYSFAAGAPYSNVAELVEGRNLFGAELRRKLHHDVERQIRIGVLVVGIGLAIGILVGSTAAYLGGWIDNVLMRFTDMVIAVPALVLALVIVMVLGNSIVNLMIAISAVAWPAYARLVRGEVLRIKELEYVAGARSLGRRSFGIVARHILPNALGPVLIVASLDIGSIVLTAAALSFLGLGPELGYADWGQMISFARNWILGPPGQPMAYWYTSFWPGLTIVLFVLGWNLLGDAFRDVLDVRGNV